MFIAFVLILLFILLGVLAGAYSVFSPFTQNIGDVIDFNSSYYGAIASIERASLALKYKSPGFEGSGGFYGTTKFGPASDFLTGGLGNITTGNNGMSWIISSRTRSIPASGDGNVDALLASADSSNFNWLPYFTTERIFLSLDNTNPATKEVYTGGTNFIYFTGGAFSGQFRLPPTVKTTFLESPLCVNISNAICDMDGDLTYDEIAVNRKLKGNYSGTAFSILPNGEVDNTNSGSNIVFENLDTMLRESIINDDNGAFFFGKNTLRYRYNPILSHTLNSLVLHNIVSSDPSVMQTKTYNELLTNTDVNPLTTGLEFSFGIVNLLYSENANIYPFLEYNISFASPVANRFYTIEGKSLVGNYNVRIIMKKSTNNESPIGDFTIIF